MAVMDCDTILSEMRTQLKEHMEVRALSEDTCILTTPFWDSSGDPIRVAISLKDSSAILDDTGAVAGHLFSLGQQAVDTPAFKLLNTLAIAHDLNLDFDEGLVKVTVPIDELFEGFIELVKVILTMVTAGTHIRVHPRRLKLFGPRVRTKIRRDYQVKNVLGLVEPDYKIQGTAVEAWPVDFHWSVRTDEESRDVYVIAVDLDILDPLRKAERVAALAVDSKSEIERNYLRIVMDTHGHNSASEVAASFLKQHSQMLGFRLYNFGEEEERQSFVEQSVDELLGQAGEHWREFWQSGTRNA